MNTTDSAVSRSVPGFWTLIGYLFAGYGLYTLTITALIAAGVVSSRELGMILRSVLLVVFLGGTVHLLGVRRGKFTWAEVGLWPPIWRREWLRLALGIAVALAVFNTLGELLTQLLRYGKVDFFEAIGAVSGYNNSAMWKGWILVWFCSALLFPVAEELFFRGAIYNWFDKHFGGLKAIIGSAMLFAVTRATFFDSKSLLLVIQSLVLGVVAAWVMQRTRSLWMPLAIHTFTLTLILLLTLLFTLLA